MKRAVGLSVFLALLSVSPAFSLQEQSPKNSTPNSQDVPHQEPGTSNPDVGKQRRPTPDSPGTEPARSPSDVPHQQPGTDNPDVGKQRRPTPDDSSTGSSSNKSKKKGSSTKPNSSTSSI
jgi:hypothetical protein